MRLSTMSDTLWWNVVVLQASPNLTFQILIEYIREFPTYSVSFAAAGVIVVVVDSV